MFKFIWNGKPDKIKRKVLFNTTENGGLKVPHLRSYFDSMKVSRVKRLCSLRSAAWKSLAVHLIGSSNEMWKYNFDTDSILIKKIKSNFWTQVAKCWSQVAYMKTPEDYEIRNQYLWYNGHIRVNKKPIYLNMWKNAGINQICDLLKEDGSVLSYMEFKEKWNTRVDFVTYYGVLQAIPKNWLTLCKDPQRRGKKSKTPLIQQIFETARATKLVYDLMIENITLLPISPVEKWKTELQIEISQVKLNEIFSLIYYTTISSKLRAFLYRFLHRCLKTNTFLFKIGIVESDHCTFCGAEKESFIHVFWECLITQRFIGQLKTWLLQFTGITQFTREEILFGIHTESLGYINMIFGVVKQYIWRCRIENNTLC